MPMLAFCTGEALGEAKLIQDCELPTLVLDRIFKSTFMSPVLGWNLNWWFMLQDA